VSAMPIFRGEKIFASAITSALQSFALRLLFIQRFCFFMIFASRCVNQNRIPFHVC
jgi:hypothetical protein